MKSENNLLSSGYSYGKIWRTTYPILISLLMEQLLGMTDTAFLGRVGEIELGASAIAGVYYTVLFMIGFGFSIGAQIVMGRRNGEAVAGTGPHEAVGRVFWQGLWFLLALACGTILLSRLASPSLLRVILSSDAVSGASMTYVLWRVPSLLFAFPNAMFRAFYVGTTRTRVLTFGSAVMVGANILLDWVLIFGHWGAPALGIQGAAIASTLAEALTLAFFIVYSLLQKADRRYGLGTVARPDRREMRELLQVASWTMVDNVIGVATWLLFFLFIEHLGEESLAIANIVRSVSGLFYIIISAFASTTATLVANTIGEDRPEGVIPVIRRILRMGFVLVLVPTVLVALFPRPVIRLFTDIPSLIGASVPTLWVMCAGSVVTLPSFVYLQAVCGTGQTRKSFWLDLWALGIYIVYCTVVIGMLHANVAVSWTADAVYGIALWLLCSRYIHSMKWKNGAA